MGSFLLREVSRWPGDESSFPLTISYDHLALVAQYGDETQKLAVGLYMNVIQDKPKPGPYTATAANILMRARGLEWPKVVIAGLRQLLPACKDRDETLCRDRIDDLLLSDEFSEWMSKEGIVRPRSE